MKRATVDNYPISKKQTRRLMISDIRAMYKKKHRGERLFTMREVAEFFGVSKSTVFRLTR